MKKKDVSAMHTMKSSELVKMISETKAKLADYMVNRYSKQSKNVREGRNYRKKIAVASTILTMKELNHE
jgi:ribosomal protein L29